MPTINFRQALAIIIGVPVLLIFLLKLFVLVFCFTFGLQYPW